MALPSAPDTLLLLLPKLLCRFELLNQAYNKQRGGERIFFFFFVMMGISESKIKWYYHL